MNFEFLSPCRTFKCLNYRGLFCCFTVTSPCFLSVLIFSFSTSSCSFSCYSFNLFVHRRYLVTFRSIVHFYRHYQLSVRVISRRYNVYYFDCILFTTWLYRLYKFRAGNAFGGAFFKSHFMNKTRKIPGLILLLDIVSGD